MADQNGWHKQEVVEVPSRLGMPDAFCSASQQFVSQFGGHGQVLAGFALGHDWDLIQVEIDLCKAIGGFVRAWLDWLAVKVGKYRAMTEKNQTQSAAVGTVFKKHQPCSCRVLCEE